jgi:glycerol-3-phosphate dehydrogenase
MAADAIDEASEVLGRSTKSATRTTMLLGAEGFAEPTGTDRHAHLLRRYGTEAVAIETLIAADATLGEPLVGGLPYVKAEAIHAVRAEMAGSVDDVLSRRTRARLLGRDASAAAAEAVARLIGPELGWDDATIAAEVEQYRASVTHERTAADLPETALDVAFGA